MGKTSYALSEAIFAAIDNNIPLAFFSLEMSKQQISLRIMLIYLGISSDDYRRGALKEDDWNNIYSFLNKLSKAPIYIDDTAGLSIEEFRSKSSSLKRKYGIKRIYVDYIGLMTVKNQDKGSNRTQIIGQISRALKGVARELNIPVFALAQMNRAVEARGGNKKPILSDLRDSGEIEQDADIVTFLYRPEYYGITEDESGNSTRGLAELIIAKHRGGALEDVPMFFNAPCTAFLSVQERSSGYNNPTIDIIKRRMLEKKSGNNLIDDTIPESDFTLF
jgi:replicative DNA helicase